MLHSAIDSMNQAPSRRPARNPSSPHPICPRLPPPAPAPDLHSRAPLPAGRAGSSPRRRFSGQFLILPPRRAYRFPAPLFHLPDSSSVRVPRGGRGALCLASRVQDFRGRVSAPETVPPLLGGHGSCQQTGRERGAAVSVELSGVRVSLLAAAVNERPSQSSST
jgi:hypothetical protein